MSLPAGTRLGPYEVLAALGSGGMGEVYKARDSRLDRLVAVKILSPAMAVSPDARERFEREAHAISRLSHPHVCALFDIGRDGDTLYLVMELLEGETLRALVAKGPLPMPEVLRIGEQIAQALAAAARQGIAHRDLKPANVMLTRTGVKLLDFGLAKTVDAAGAAELLTAAELTAPGAWLGTAPYMAPEQIDGRTVDSRSDVFALGAVLYEMATGQRAFGGDTTAGIASSVLRVDPPPPSSIRPEVPAQFDRLVHECLEKEPDRRWQSAHDVALQLAAIRDAGELPESRPAGRRRSLALFAWPGSIAATALVVAAATMRFSQTDAAPPPRFELQINPPATTVFTYTVETVRFAVSPDGQRLAFVAAGPGSTNRVWLRSLTSLKTEPVAGTDGASTVFWSPDTRSIAFVIGDTLKRLELASGAAVAICRVPSGAGLSGTWSRSGEIVFASIDGDALYRVSSTGGDPVNFVKPDPSRDEYQVKFPSFLPDGHRYLYLARHRNGSSFLMLGDSDRSPTVVMPIESNAQYIEPGWLVYARNGALVAQSFNPSSGQVAGGPVVIAGSVRFFLSTSAADFSASPSGSIVFQSHVDRARLAWLDRSGREIGTVGSPGNYLDVRIVSGEGGALASRTLPATGTFDIWSFDFNRGTETRVTLDDAFTEIEGMMVPGGGAMIFAATRGRGLRLMRRDLRTGRDERLMPEGLRMQGADDVSPDGRRLAYEERTDAGPFNLWIMPLTGTAAPSQIRSSPFNETRFRFAPDGDHYTFVSDESGRAEVYVSQLSGVGKTVVSTSGGIEARWTRDGREILYVSPDLRMMAVSIRTTPTIELGTPVALFAMASKRWVSFDATRDGNRFLVIVPEVVANEQPLTAMLGVIPK
jgi:serine/threonine protein kinase/Tol biopolymer transport system component